MRRLIGYFPPVARVSNRMDPDERAISLSTKLFQTPNHKNMGI
jgi:hypothetical protein